MTIFNVQFLAPYANTRRSCGSEIHTFPIPRVSPHSLAPVSVSLRHISVLFSAGSHHLSQQQLSIISVTAFMSITPFCPQASHLTFSPAFFPRCASQQCGSCCPAASPTSACSSVAPCPVLPAPGPPECPICSSRPLPSLHPGFVHIIYGSLFLPIPLKSSPSERSVRFHLSFSGCCSTNCTHLGTNAGASATKFCCIISVLCVHKPFLQVDTGFLMFLVCMLPSLSTPQCLGRCWLVGMTSVI